MSLTLELLPEPYAICRLAAHSPIPAWAEGGGFVGISRSPEELSIVCWESRVPAGVQAERGWRALKLRGPFEFSLCGILASVLNPLAQAQIGILAVSTFDTDYVWVKSGQLEPALQALESAGHVVQIPKEHP
ncbi:ACT domain-containing protein [Meiothermus granaticius]|uniref:ACT domain protein n=1 Tax=Meiothermus granaticius NBRC 107808 TaxID=1227551 RepID=A0A399FD55_9DEIN|nr:ACT domain-containing protein [Meiothermus granaticius]RIH93685.1 ACT domain protein [Meiothermus granaticius NBRC 107808]GEM85791.1 ACT domain-containing protein [Meiothermus granaticius NBRC 107808]